MASTRQGGQSRPRNLDFNKKLAIIRDIKELDSTDGLLKPPGHEAKAAGQAGVRTRQVSVVNLSLTLRPLHGPAARALLCFCQRCCLRKARLGLAALPGPCNCGRAPCCVSRGSTALTDTAAQADACVLQHRDCACFFLAALPPCSPAADSFLEPQQAAQAKELPQALHPLDSKTSFAGQGGRAGLGHPRAQGGGGADL